MAKFVSERYPQLVVHDLGVRFRDGEATVLEATAKALKAANIPGVRAVGGRPSKQEAPASEAPSPATSGDSPGPSE